MIKYLLIIPLFTFSGFAVCAQQTNSMYSQAQDRLNPIAHTKPITALATSADGKWLASASSGDGVVIIWNLESGKMKQRFRLDKEAIDRILFSFDNQILILACNRELVFLNSATGIIQKVVPFQQPISSFCPSPLYDRLFVTTGNPPFFSQPVDSTSEFLIYSLTENKIERKFLFFQPIKKVEFVLETNSLALAFYDGNISLRDYMGYEITKHTFSYKPTVQTAIIPDNTIIIASGNQLQKRNLLSGKDEGSIKIPGLVSIQDMKIGDNSSVMVILSNYPKPIVRKINLVNGETINQCRLASNASVLMTDNKQKTLFVTDGETIRIVDLESLKTIKILGGHNEWITSLNLDIQKKELYTLTGDSLKFTWNLKSGKLTAASKLPKIELTNAFTLPENKSKIQLLGFDRQIIINYSDTYDPINGIFSKADTLKASDGFKFNSAVLSPDEEKLAIACSDGTIRMFSLTHMKFTGRFIGHSSGVTTMVFLNDNLLFSGSEDHTVKLWAVVDFSLLATLVTLGEKDWIVFDEDCKYHASAKNLYEQFNETNFGSEKINIRFEPNLLSKIFKKYPK
ncbi:MAG: WD40 repeat domain-containing protein [Bacteroidales bacterium]